jgi:hypothetical protein
MQKDCIFLSQKNLQKIIFSIEKLRLFKLKTKVDGVL